MKFDVVDQHEDHSPIKKKKKAQHEDHGYAEQRILYVRILKV